MNQEEHRVLLPALQAQVMMSHARSGAPDEVCGYIAAVPGEGIVAALPVVNGARNKRITYEMEGQSQHRAFMYTARQGWDQIGVYHSHPATRAFPSATDQALAFDPYDNAPRYPGNLYFIVSLANPQAPEIRAFLLPDLETIVEVEVIIE